MKPQLTTAIGRLVGKKEPQGTGNWEHWQEHAIITGGQEQKREL